MESRRSKIPGLSDRRRSSDKYKRSSGIQHLPEQEARRYSCHTCGIGRRRCPGPVVSVREPLPHPRQPGLKPLRRQQVTPLRAHTPTPLLYCAGTGLSRFLLMALPLQSIPPAIETAVRFQSPSGTAARSPPGLVLSGDQCTLPESMFSSLSPPAAPFNLRSSKFPGCV